MANTNTATVVTETIEQKLARLEAENKAMQAKIDNGFHTPNKLKMKVGEKGGLSIYGLGRFPVTLYKEQWLRLLAVADEIRKFIRDNDSKLKAKGD